MHHSRHFFYPWNYTGDKAYMVHIIISIYGAHYYLARLCFISWNSACLCGHTVWFEWKRPTRVIGGFNFNIEHIWSNHQPKKMHATVKRSPIFTTYFFLFPFWLISHKKWHYQTLYILCFFLGSPAKIMTVQYSSLRLWGTKRILAWCLHPFDLRASSIYISIQLHFIDWRQNKNFIFKITKYKSLNTALVIIAYQIRHLIGGFSQHFLNMFQKPNDCGMFMCIIIAICPTVWWLVQIATQDMKNHSLCCNHQGVNNRRIWKKSYNCFLIEVPQVAILRKSLHYPNGKLTRIQRLYIRYFWQGSCLATAKWYNVVF